MSKSDRETEQTETGKEIQASVDRMMISLNRLDNICKREAKRGRNPPQTSKYWDALLDADMAVMDAFSRIRKYLRVDREEYWNTKVIGFDRGQPVVFGSRTDEIEREDLDYVGRLSEPDDVDTDELLFIEDYQGAYTTVTREQTPRFGEPRDVTETVPRVLDPDDYRRAARVIDEARRKLGFTPTPRESTPRTEITREMIEDVQEWRQNNLPEQYLGGENGDSE